MQVMLSTRNVFIANLAISDLLLCTFTMPLTLQDLLTKYWPFGPNMDTVHYNYLFGFLHDSEKRSVTKHLMATLI